MKASLFVIFLLISTGCGKKDSAISNNVPPPAAEAAAIRDDRGQTSGSGAGAAARPNDANPGEAPAEGAVGVVHPFMTQQLHIFIQQTGRMPKDFREFASARMDGVPRLAPGMKYVVDTNTAEVKIVRQ